MNEIQLGEWFYDSSVSTEDPDIYLVKLKKGDRRWYARLHLKKFMFLDILPPDCLPSSEHLANGNVYYTSIAI